MDRRKFLKLSTLSGLTVLSHPHSLFAFDRLPGVSSEKKLVVILLNGGADGLSLFPPYGDDEYYLRRPTIAVKRDAMYPLTELFGMHRGFGRLIPAWKEGDLGIIHQFGSPTVERSHNLATERMAHGIDAGEFPLDGFLSRALFERFGESQSSLRAVAIQLNFPLILQGSAGAVNIPALNEFLKDQSSPTDVLDFRPFFEKSDDENFKRQAGFAFPMVEKIRDILAKEKRSIGATAEYTARSGNGVGLSLRDIATLINAKAGLRVAVTSGSGWDTHVYQPGHLDEKITELSRGLTELRASLKASGEWQNTTVVVLTEFGRLVAENGSMGTDHGHGTAAIVMGGGLSAGLAGKIKHDWKALKVENLSEHRELSVVHDYRDLMAEALISQLQVGEEQLKKIFPATQERN